MKEQKKQNKLTSKLIGYHLANNSNQVLIEAKNYFKIACLLSSKSFNNKIKKFNNPSTFNRLFARLTTLGKSQI